VESRNNLIITKKNSIKLLIFFLDNFIILYVCIHQVGRRSEEFSEAQHVMRESVVQRRDMTLIDDGRESTTPVEPTSGLGGEFRDSHDTLHNSTDNTTCVERIESEDEDDINSNVRITVIYNTRL